MEQSLPQELVKQVGGSFRLTALLQKRVRELVRGQKPLFETRERNYIKIASEELKRGLIAKPLEGVIRDALDPLGGRRLPQGRERGQTGVAKKIDEKAREGEGG